MTCGTILQQTNIVSDNTFIETAGGDSMRTGQTVGAGESRARNYDTTASHLTGGMSSLDVSLANGSISNPHHPDAAIEFYKLARMHHNFIQGRLIRSVAAVCLYAACRRDKGENNRWMLIDFADKCSVNVFELSGTFKDLIRALFCDAQGLIQAPLEPVNIESLILRYAEQMNFGRMKQRIANEAVRIVQRMSRDWMVDGRRPGGICGAALILAARMNNFRRVVREVVYTVKITEVTINKRLEEFQETESSALTVEQFRTTDLPTEADPPSFKNKDKAKKKRGRKRKAREVEEEDSAEDESPRSGSATPANVNGQLQTPALTQAQQDRENMPPPPLPLDPRLQTPSSSQASETPPTIRGRGRGRPRGKTKPPVEPSTQDLQVEAEIEADIEGLLRNEIIVETARQIHENPDVPGAPQTQQVTPDSSQAPAAQASSTEIYNSEQSSSAVPSLKDRLQGHSNTLPDQPLSESQILSQLTEHARSRSPSPPTPINDPRHFITQDSTTQPLLDLVPSTEEISDSEFPPDDPELSNCILSPAETALKERIWTHENSAYLRAQQSRLLKRQLAEANGTARVVVRRKRKKRRMGDMSDREVGQGPEDAADSVAAMMNKRAFSRKINYGILKKTFTPKGTPSGSQAGSRMGSEAPATPSASPTTVVDPDTGEIRIEGSSPRVQEVGSAGKGGSKQDAIEVEDGGDSDDPEDYYDSEDERRGEGEGEGEDMDMAGVDEVVNRLGYGRNGDGGGEDDGD
ncbi:MAG: hypothetical protein LQ352_003157 [Teloschistes flavicans]|nr:MAG: hypothetical protein LQ352_003157 [Teloschistes flavicans]